MNPKRLLPQVRCDGEQSDELHHVWNANIQVYCALKIWRQLKREKHRSHAARWSAW